MVDKKQELSEIIDRIKERFFRPEVKDEKFESIEEILSKPVFFLKNVEKVAALTLEEIFKIKTIQDLANLNLRDPYEALISKSIKRSEVRWNRKRALMEKAEEQFKPLNFDLHESIVIAQMICRSWEKRQFYADDSKKERKVICMGLDNAGKTALLSFIGGKTKLTEIPKIQPTRGVEWKDFSSRNFKLIILDMGGQIDYRRRYLQEPEKYFVKVSALLYVIDIQDTARYAESLEYFKQIVQMLEKIGEKPQIMIFLHKSDPDIINDPDYKINLEYLRGEFFKVLEPEGKESLFDFDLFPTSIYSFSAEPEFTTTVKDLLNVQSLNDPMLRKVEGLGEILDKLTNTMMNLTAHLNEHVTLLSQQMAMLSNRVSYLEQSVGTDSTKGLLQPLAIPQPTPTTLGLTPPPPVPGSMSQNPRPESPQSLRQNIMEELRTIFAKRRQMENES
ncbi:MAG: hypothetical protein RBG13Loki_3933 [Promethearchaeota archaeon CR_4]|nr:MAG: hypothetical protein RBG13Loki_3933 [Candidatus Lokiarchaeota archaeon CR_4]